MAGRKHQRSGPPRTSVAWEQRVMRGLQEEGAQDASPITIAKSLTNEEFAVIRPVKEGSWLPVLQERICQIFPGSTAVSELQLLLFGGVQLTALRNKLGEGVVRPTTQQVAQAIQNRLTAHPLRFQRPVRAFLHSRMPTSIRWQDDAFEVGVCFSGVDSNLNRERIVAFRGAARLALNAKKSNVTPEVVRAAQDEERKVGSRSIMPLVVLPHLVEESDRSAVELGVRLALQDCKQATHDPITFEPGRIIQPDKPM